MERPTRPPVDAEEEKQRLIDDAVERGIDEAAALELADRVAQIEPRPDAYRLVDRRLATGHSLEETEEILLGDGTADDDEGSTSGGS